MFTPEFLDAIERLNGDIQMQINQYAAELYRAMWRGERDLAVLEGLADPLLDNCPEMGEEDYRNFIGYVREFNAEKALEYEDFLEDIMGYKNHVVLAAAKLARELHKGQKDKGGNDYFTSHLMSVAEGCHDKYGKVVGFLHDAAEDCEISEHEVVERLKGILEEWKGFEDLEDLEDEWRRIEEALVAMNHHRHATREEYIENIKRNEIAIRVKLSDLRNNMDLSRIGNPTEKDFKRRERYEREYEELLGALKSGCSESC